MRTMESLDQLMARIVAEDRRKHDVIADTRKMSVEVTVPALRDFTQTGAHEIIRDAKAHAKEQQIRGTKVNLLLDGEGGVSEYVLTDHALGQVATDLKIPKRYFDRMKVEAPDLFRTNVHHWMYSDPKARMIRGLTNGDGLAMTGRAWMSDKFRRLDHVEIARTLLPEFDGLGMPVEFHQAAVTEERLYIRALFPRLERDVKHVGDTVRWGVEIGNSEVGSGSLTIKGFAMVLACRNGLVTMKALNARHVGKREGEGILSNEALAADDVAFWLAARDTLRHVCSETAFNTVVDQLQGLDDTPVASPVAATKVLAREFGLTEAEEEAVMLSLVADPNGIGRGQWGMLNAITATAQQADSFDRQAEMEGIGWKLAEMPAKQWEKVALAVR